MALKDLFIKQQFDWIVSTVVFNFRRVTGVMQASHVALAVKNPSANARDTRDAGTIPGSGRSPGGRHRNPLQYSCLKNLTDREVWRTRVHRVAKSQTELKQFSMQAFIITIFTCLEHM